MSYDLGLILDDGSATFAAPIGMQHSLGELKTVSVRDWTAQEIRAARIVQESGTGTTTFAATVETDDALRPGLDLGGTHFVFLGPVFTQGQGQVSGSPTGPA